MASISQAREKARRYSRLSADYAYWSPRVKDLVNNAGNEDWGTFIVASALLEEVVPRNERDRVEREIEFEEEFADYRDRTEKENHVHRRLCVTVSVAFAVLCIIVRVALLFGPNPQSGPFCNNPVFNVFGFILFSCVGSISSGYALGAYVDRAKRGGVLAFFISCFTGILCPVVCLFFPPVALLLAWCAWRSSNMLKPKVIHTLGTQSTNRENHGQRVYAKDTRAPQFVKNAVRLAGIYSRSEGSVGEISRMALSTNQNNYGAFVVYNALLTEYHAEQQANAAVDAIDNEADEENLNGEGGGSSGVGAALHDTASRPEYSDSRSIVIRGTCSSFAVALVLWLTVDFEVLLASSSFFVWPYVLGVLVFVVSFVGVLVGWRSAVRIASIYGLDARCRHLAGIARPAWFSAYTILIGIFLVYIIAMC